MRQNLIITAIGDRGTGKTTWLLGDHEAGVPSIIDIYPHHKDMSVLIVDTLDHPTYRKRGIPVLTPDELKRWRNSEPSIIRTYSAKPDEDIFPTIQNRITNCLIIYEDCKKYLGHRLDPDTERMILDSKQKNLDMIFLYHAWGWVPKDFYRIMDMIQVFKTRDSPKSRQTDLGGDYKEAQQIWDQVQKDPSPYANKTLTLG